jgi:hypothetical protein
MILGTKLADPEHVLLGLIRVAQTSHPDCGFARIVGFDDRLRIRNEVLRLVARPPDPAEVARRKPMARAAPTEFESYAVNLLCDALNRMPAGGAAAITQMTMQFSFVQDDPTQPVIEVGWNTAVNGETAHRLDNYAVRIPASGADAQRGLELRRRWLDELPRHPPMAGGDDPTETERALTRLGARLNRLLHDGDVLWDTVGHSIAALLAPPSHHDAPPRRRHVGDSAGPVD